MILKALKNTVFENINNSDGLFTKHYHETYTIGITHAGLFKSCISKDTALSYKCSTRIINPHEIHYGDSSKWAYTNFYPSVALIKQMYEEMFFEKKIPVFEKHIVNDSILFEHLFVLFNSIYTKSDSMQIESNLISCLSYLIKNYTSNTKKEEILFNDKKIIKNCIEFINYSNDKNLSLEDLAKNVSLSKYHFLRVFKNNVGLTPHQYIINNKIKKAKELILNGSSLSIASFEAGFCDQSHFIRSFKKVYGYLPKELLKKSNFVLY